MALFDRPESDQSLKNLSTLLSRLDRTLNDDDNAPHPRSIYERQKIRVNFEHARALLLHLEHDSAAIKAASRRQNLQTDLRAKRDQVRRLQARVQLLDGDAQDDTDGDDDEEDEDARGGHTGAGLNAARAEEEEEEPAVQVLASTLRSRTGGASKTGDAPATATATALPTASGGDQDKLETRDEILTSDRHEQEQIMDSLLLLTRELKSSATMFHGSLEGEKDLLSSTVKGLDNNVSGLDSAGKKMGMLQKMSEGKGWFGRFMLYAYIAGLWVLALVIVFVLPKLRF